MVLCDGQWRPLYQVVRLDDEAAIEDEVARQLAAFRHVVGRDPTHIDSHQHVHRLNPVAGVALALAEQLGVPLRNFSASVRYCGDFYGQADDGSPNHEAISASGLTIILSSLPPGVTELACHPALGDDVEGMYRSQRPVELETLCDPRLRSLLESMGVELRSFADPICASLDSAASAGRGG